MNIAEFQNYLDEVIQVLDDTRDKDFDIMATDLTALVRDRVQNDKTKYDGSSFGQYSDTPLPYWFYEDKGRVSNAELKALEKHGYFVSYSEFREVNNVESNEIDLTMTGAMWSSAGLEEIQDKDGVISTTITFKGEENKLKAGYQSDRFGNILLASEEEIEIAFSAYEERRIDLIFRLLG